MPKCSKEVVASRSDEIIFACEKLYQTMSFKDITMKEISGETSFSRPSIYNYFETKEEIFLALHKKEYDRWSVDLDRISSTNETMTDKELASAVATSLSERVTLLKLLSMNIFDMEANSRVECITDFKRSYIKASQLLGQCISKFTNCSAEETNQTIQIFSLFLFGVYPLVFATTKQKQAMDKAGIKYNDTTIYELVNNNLYHLLNKEANNGIK